VGHVSEGVSRLRSTPGTDGQPLQLGATCRCEPRIQQCHAVGRRCERELAGAVGHARGTNAPSCTTVCPVDILPSSNFPRPHAHTEQLNPHPNSHTKNNGAIWLLELPWHFAQQPHINEKERVRKKKSQWKIELQKRTDTGIIQTFS
jgi:hypothetical protein